MGAIAEGDAPGFSVQVAAKERPEHSASYDKALAVAAEVESICPRSFIVIQDVPEASYLRRSLIQTGSPDMH
jgi:hypothetical protein